MIRASLVVFLLFIYSGNAASVDKSSIEKPVSAKAEVDRTSLNIGDKITYLIKVKAPKDFEIQIPSFGESLADFDVKDFLSSQSGFFSITYTHSYIIDIFETWEFTIPAAVIKYKARRDEEWKEAVTDEITVTVQSLLGETEQAAEIRDIKGPYNIKNFTYLYIALAVIAVISIVIAIYMIQKKRRGQEKITTPLSPPVHETALNALSALLDRNLINKGKIREFYFELSNIVRHYLEDRFYLKAPEMTTEEFLLHLKNSDKLNLEHKSLLREFLSHCDMVKFAKHLPGDKEIESSYGSAQRLVEQTRETRTSEEASK
jgi:hypothetical protein